MNGKKQKKKNFAVRETRETRKIREIKMNNLPNWIIFAVISAITFGIGDFIVVSSEEKRMNVVTLYITYTILIGLLNLGYLVFFQPAKVKEIFAFKKSEWTIVGALCLFYLIAYLLHFMAIQQASNPGYANALVMFHVAVLTLLSYWFLAKPLNTASVIGIILMFVGGVIITLSS